VTQEEMEGIATETICPVISEGDAIGSVILLGREGRSKMGEVEQKVAASAAGFLGKQMEQ
jgi:AbrB family transcriptional regulator (stage V sporulation protein T)